MESPDEAVSYVDRREIILETTPSRQISADKSLRQEVNMVEDVVINCIGSQPESSLQLDQQFVTTTKRSEVTVEIQGVRETTFSSATVVSNRVRTVYGRSLSGSVSSADADTDHREVSLDSNEDSEEFVFGAHAHIDGEGRERKISDSYYISQTYQVNAELSPKSVTSVRSMSFRSSKDFELNRQENDTLESPGRFVDRLEEIIAGGNPEVVGSPKEKHVRFLWYDNETEDSETTTRMQSARENVQNLIESVYMVSDICNVIDDTALGVISLENFSSESQSLITNSATSQSLQTDRAEKMLFQSSEKFERTRKDDSSNKNSSTETSTEVEDNVKNNNAVSASENSIFVSTSFQSETTRHLVTSPSQSCTTDNLVHHSVASDSRSSSEGRQSSPIAVAYSPGMAIRNYTLEELTMKKHSRAIPDKIEVQAKSLRFDEESSGVDIDTGSSVDDVDSQWGIDSARVYVVPSESYLQRYELLSGGVPAHPSSTDEEDESLDKLVDLESLQVGYKFHDIGMMHLYGGVDNLAYEDLDDNRWELPSGSEVRTLSSTEQKEETLSETVSKIYYNLEGGLNSSASLTETAAISFDSQISETVDNSQGLHAIHGSTKAVFPERVQSLIKNELVRANASLAVDAQDSTKDSGKNISVQTNQKTKKKQKKKQKHLVQNQNIATLSEQNVSETRTEAKSGVKRSVAGNSTSLPEAASKQTVPGTEDIRDLKGSDTLSSVHVQEKMAVYGSVTQGTGKNLLTSARQDTSENRVERLDGSGVAQEVVVKRGVSASSAAQAAHQVDDATRYLVSDDSSLSISINNNAHLTSFNDNGSVLESGRVTSKLRDSESLICETNTVQVVQVSGEVTSQLVRVTEESGRVISESAQLTEYSVTVANALARVSEDSVNLTDDSRIGTFSDSNIAKRTSEEALVSQLSSSTAGSESENRTTIQGTQSLAALTLHQLQAGASSVDSTGLVQQNAGSVTGQTEAANRTTVLDGSSVAVQPKKKSKKKLRTKDSEVSKGVLNFVTGTSQEELVSSREDDKVKVSVDTKEFNQFRGDSLYANFSVESEMRFLEGRKDDAVRVNVAGTYQSTDQTTQESVIVTGETKISSYLIGNSAERSERETSEKSSLLEVSSKFIKGFLADNNIQGQLCSEVSLNQSNSTSTNYKDTSVRKNQPESISVTRRFNISPKFEASLKSLGAVLKSESLSIAVYYDTNNFDLTLSDCWLRSVNGKWQFHQGFTKLLNDQTLAEYQELEQSQDIQASLLTILNCFTPADPDVSLSTFILRTGLREFVRYSTHRKTYWLNGMVIELELPEYGFWVGSVTATGPVQLQQAVTNIQTFWTSTGVNALNLLVE